MVGSGHIPQLTQHTHRGMYSQIHARTHTAEDPNIAIIKPPLPPPPAAEEEDAIYMS